MKRKLPRDIDSAGGEKAGRPGSQDSECPCFVLQGIVDLAQFQLFYTNGRHKCC